MAIVANPIGSELVLVMDNGTSASGGQLTKNRVYPDVKTTAADADVYSVAQSLLGLQEKTNLSIQRRNTVEIQDI
ncbi:DUF1659 domain-containing protein [Syntrophomonas palmitatica]|uniref:DUF1659 domain-containing protein n=1 Tax=Syntrophomonas palmitatica TaxID=402877 RepID=UPI0006CF38E4|nr:DUF1659 domain-containing protein [Syntrophomonas palmitatica]